MRRLLEGLGPSLSRHYGQIYRLATHVAFRDRYFGELPNQIIVRYFLSSKWQGVKYQIS